MAVIITEFFLEQYGNGIPLRVLDLGNGLNVALVRSEAGCARLLGIVPSVLYGREIDFAGRKRLPHGEAVSPPARAAVFVRSDHGVFRIERERTQRGWGPPRIHSPDGTQYEPSFFQTILDGVGRNAYREVFTLSLHRLAQIVRGGRRGADRLQQLAQFLQEKSPQGLAALQPPPVFDIADVQKHLTALTAVVATHAATSLNPSAHESREKQDPQKLEGELRKIDASVAESRTKLEQAAAEIHQLQGALVVRRVKARLAELQREIAAAHVPRAARESAAVAEASMERLQEKIQSCREQLKQLAEERVEVDRQRAELAKSSSVARLRPQIEAVLMQEKTLVKEEEAAEQLAIRIEELDSRLEAVRLQSSHQVAAFYAPQVSDAQAHGRLDQLADRVRQLDHDIKITEDRLESAHASHFAAIPGSSAFAASPTDAVAIHEAEQRVLKLRELAAADDKYQRLQADAADLEVQVQRLYGKQLMPLGTTLAFAVPFAVGVALVIYGLVMRRGQTNWQLVLLGMAAAFVTAMIKMTLDRSVSDRLLAARNRLSRIRFDQQQLESLQGETGAGRVNPAGKLEAAEQDLAELRSRLDNAGAEYGETEPAAASSDMLQTRLNELRRQRRDADAQWRDLMLQLDLPPTSTPAAAREALTARALNTQRSGNGRSADLETQREQLQHELQRRRDWLALASGQLRQLLKELRHAPHGNSTSEQIDLLRESLAEHHERMRELRQLSRARKRLRQKAAQNKQTGRRLSSQRRQLRDELRLKEEQHRTKQRLQQDRLKLLERQRDSQAREIDDLRSAYGLEEQSTLLELSVEDLQSRLENEAKKLTSLPEKLVKLSERRGRCLSQLAAARERGSPAPDNREAWENVLAATKKIERQLQRTSRQAVQDSRRHDQQHQQLQRFEYLEHAGTFLATLTGGQYVGLTISAQTGLMLCDDRGHTVSLADVTREHFANVYFSLWLARLEAYADQGVLLPVVMEDPLPATRKLRRKPVARLLTQLAARGHQLILVTNSSQSAATFARLDVPVADLSDRERVPIRSADDSAQREAALS